MTEDTRHQHRCDCGFIWDCSRTDCFWGDRCQRCQDAELADWAEAHGQTDYQPPLEPESALLGEDQ